MFTVTASACVVMFTRWRPSAMAFRRAGVPLGAAAGAGGSGEDVVRATDGEVVAQVVRAVRGVG